LATRRGNQIPSRTLFYVAITSNVKCQFVNSAYSRSYRS